MKELDHLIVRGAREHNLKNVHLEIPKKKLVVFTGVSGSGKSSLAFDTLYAEGQRRYVESLSAYARQFLGQMEKPIYESIRGLSPTISIEQKAASKNPRSTVGTITEIYDYLRVLYARVGQQFWEGRPVVSQSAQDIVQELESLPEGTKYMVLAPLVENRKGEHKELFTALRTEGFARVRINGEIVSLDDEKATKLDKKKRNTVEVVVDRLVSRPKQRARVTDSVETALAQGKGQLVVAFTDDTPDKLFSEGLYDPYTKKSFPPLSPQSFSFNSPIGMCPSCHGLGTAMEIDPDLIVPDKTLSIDKGAVKPWRLVMARAGGTWTRQIVKAISEHYQFDLKTPFCDLTEVQRNAVLYGSGDEEIAIKWKKGKSAGEYHTKWEGVIPNLMRRFEESESDEARRRISRYFSSAPCRNCGGERLRPESQQVYVGGKSVVDVNRMTIAEAHRFFSDLELEGNTQVIAAELLKEIVGRLGFLLNVGLDYLTLNRPGPTLSGGESQRIRLASQMGSELTGVLYILDEPSIGLHQRDNKRLIATLEHLRDLGNSVIVVEHDSETMERADWLVDFGPGAGVNGGAIVASATPAEVAAHSESLTGQYLSGRKRIEIPEKRRPMNPERQLLVEGAEVNNLQGVDVAFPVGLFTCVTGVSGAGKSSVVNNVLYPAAATALNNANLKPGPHTAIKGLDHFDKVIDIDQTPIGRTPRSNPATYTKVWDDIRKVFASTRESRAYGYEAGRFSFNVKGGRCESCQGAGVVKVEMHFLADVFVTCETCNGARFNDATLRVKYLDMTVSQLLETSVDEAAELFRNHKRISRIMRTLQDVGLGYLKLGQPSTTLSGGEAQRIKLSRELARVATGRTLYILDEPSTGLHFEDVRKLLEVIQRLVDAGNTVVMIEHNLDIIKTADWIVDMGPEGGFRGGKVVAAGTPEEVAQVPGSYTGQFLKELLAKRPS
ncbi:MAG: excinuclease ABC subunit UvrA [Bradymonadia bacterium]